jgi:hypothetical protein
MVNTWQLLRAGYLSLSAASAAFMFETFQSISYMRCAFQRVKSNNKSRGIHFQLQVDIITLETVLWITE